MSALKLYSTFDDKPGTGERSPDFCDIELHEPNGDVRILHVEWLPLLESWAIGFKDDDEPLVICETQEWIGQEQTWPSADDGVYYPKLSMADRE